MPKRLDQIQETLLERAINYRDAHTVTIDTKEALSQFFEKEGGGFALTHFAGDAKLEETIQKEMGITIRCLPFSLGKEEGICPFTGEKSLQRVIFAKSY